MLPAFDSRGFLPPGIHRCTGGEFLQRFAESDKRREFERPIRNIINYAASVHAESILMGGSFVSSKVDPEDVDCVILFRVEKQIPAVRDGLVFGSKRVDVFFASKDSREIQGSFLRLFRTNKFDEAVGAVEIVINDEQGSHWNIDWWPDENTFEIVKRVYLNHRYFDTVKRDKVLVTVHGIKTHGEWNSDVTLIASANGWTVAPFYYGYTQPIVFGSKAYRNKIVENFRDFLSDVCEVTETRAVSVLAHSFGTYIAMKYITGWERPPTVFDTLILTGALVTETFPFEELGGKVGHVLNEVAPNDEWVEWAKVANLGRDRMFGNAGTRGFTYQGAGLTQHRSEIFSHTNVIKRDVMVSRWMPALEAHVGRALDDRERLYRQRMDAELGIVRAPKIAD